MAKVLLILLESLYVKEPQAQDLPVAREPSDIIDDNLSYNHEDVNTDDHDCNVDEETEGAKLGCNYTCI